MGFAFPMLIALSIAPPGHFSNLRSPHDHPDVAPIFANVSGVVTGTIELLIFHGAQSLPNATANEMAKFLGRSLPVEYAIILADSVEGLPSVWEDAVIEILATNRHQAVPSFLARYGHYSPTQKARVYYQLGRLGIRGFGRPARSDCDSSEVVNVLNGCFTLGYFARYYVSRVENNK
jgi:hypothetical protein